MKKTSLMRAIEARFPGQDIRMVVERALAQNPTPEAAASELGISARSLLNWQAAFAAAENAAEPAGAAR